MPRVHAERSRPAKLHAERIFEFVDFAHGDTFGGAM
jgi:hypothetical protein